MNAIPKRRKYLALVLVLVSIPGVAGFYYRFCNIPRHPAEWTAQRVDAAIDRGLEFLASSGALLKPLDAGGEHVVHQYLIDLILAKQSHPRLQAQRLQANRLNAHDPKWGMYKGLPGWTLPEVEDADRGQVQRAILGSREKYNRWLVWTVHADWAEILPSDRKKLFENLELQNSSYDLTHALIVYRLLELKHPEIALRLRVPELIAETNQRISRYQYWAPRCSDSYHERVAFWLMLDKPPPISRRWIERILTVQQPDGGWTFTPPYLRTIQEMFGLSFTPLLSKPHPTFLALLALAYYRDLMRAEGTYPAGQANSKAG